MNDNDLTEEPTANAESYGPFDPGYDEDGELWATFNLPGFGLSRMRVLNPKDVVVESPGPGSADPGSIPGVSISSSATSSM